MEHEEIYLLMMDALDGELPDDGWDNLEVHLQTCLACAQEWYALQAVETLLRTTPALAPPADFVQRTLVRLPHPAYRVWMIGSVYTLLLLSGVVPLVLAGILFSTVGTVVFDLGLLGGVLRSLWETLSLLPVILTAMLNLVGTFISQQPAIVGVLLMMVGIIMVWGGVYRQLVFPAPRLMPANVRV
ncbi:MAG: hypothetical protein V9G20_03065 [Candidatus Promineifilaceae bacterium]